MDSLSQALRILRAGGLVAFPTETVYGLGADATNPAAVRKIFAAKGRPSTNPIIVHVADESVARRYAALWPANASMLTAKFWPGPLTLVVPRAPAIAPEVCAGRNTVGLRAPDHPLALELLRAFDGPIAAPSANRSTHVSPTTADHVREELGDKIDLILDGGPCRVGIESTVLNLTGDIPRILRPGAITRAHIESEIGPVELFTGSVSPAVPAASPGQHALHYAPRAAAYCFSREQADAVSQWRQQQGGGAIAIVSLGPLPQSLRDLVFQQVQEMPGSPQDYARFLYAALREVDRAGVEAILLEMPPDEPAWAAVRDRITRAAKPLET